jgi:peptide/nickel transport system permease protein
MVTPARSPRGKPLLLTYVVRRVLQAVPLLVAATLAAYFIMNAAPGGPLAVYLHNPHVTPGQIKILARNLGLDLPWYDRYVSWVWGVVRGQWGYSYATGQSVAGLVGQTLPHTLYLMVSAFVISLGLAIPIGVLAATHQYSFADNVISVASFFAWSMPTFWFGLMLQLVFSVDLHWLPPSGMYSPILPPSFGQLLLHLIMPASVLGLGSIASWSRFLRSSMLENLGADFVRTARAKGVSPFGVVMRHVMRNSLIPIITIVGLDVPAFFAGAVITEQVFAWPGMGQLFFQAISNRDYPIMMIILLIGTMLLIAGNLLADLLYAVVDPRIRYS